MSFATQCMHVINNTWFSLGAHLDLKSTHSDAARFMEASAQLKKDG